MYICKVDKTNHAITIIDKTTKRGITMRNIGEEMAAFLIEMAQKASASDKLEKTVIPTVKENVSNVD